MTTVTETLIPRLGLFALFLKFLRFGLLAFGGPVAQIGMLRQVLVNEDRWIGPDRFNRLLAVFQVLPGPEAHELCVHFGIMSRGRIGGLLAGLGFMLPGLCLMLAAGWLYRHWLTGLAGAAPVMLGVQLVIVAVIMRAVVRIGEHTVRTPLLWGLTIGGFIATFLGVPFWIPLVAAGLIAGTTMRRGIAVVAVAVILAAAITIGTGRGILPAIGGTSGIVTTTALFVAGLKGGLLTFGGAYTAIPYVRADTVGRGWMSDASFLDGVALANILPAPLVIFATFAGYLCGGLPGALAITAGMFLPAFAFSLLFYERLETLVENAAFHRFLDGVAAAVVGIIAATSVGLGWSTFTRSPDIVPAALIFVAALVVVWRVKGMAVVPALVVAGALAGWLTLT